MVSSSMTGLVEQSAAEGRGARAIASSFLLDRSDSELILNPIPNLLSRDISSQN